ncbi:MAG: hypothetical protein ACLP5E_20015 [Streptosporangiaceae bacterium]
MPPVVQPPPPPKPQPADSQPADSQPAESQPAESRPADSRPADSRPAVRQPTESAALRPAERQPAERQPTESAALRPAGRADPVHQQRSVAALFLALLSLFGVLGLSNFQRGVYIVAFALVAGAMAVWLAGTAIRRARRGGTAGPRGSGIALAIGMVGVLVSGVLLAGFALFGKQVSTYSQCLSGANTIVAQQTCRTQFTRAIENAAR